MKPVLRCCPVCGQGAYEPSLQKGQLSLVRCLECSMVYCNPVSGQFASGEYYDQAGAGYYLTPAKLEGDYSEARFRRELRLFRKHCHGGAILDVGCSTGGFLYQLGRRFPGSYDVLGLDASGPALDYAASRGIPVARGQFLEEDFGSKQFDAVSFWAVLEHLLDPKAFLEKACAILKPGGLCLVLVPNMESLAARMLGGHYRYIYPQHLNYFTRPTLRRLAGSRFAVIELRTTHFNPIILWQDWRSGGQEVQDSQRAALLQRTTAYKQNPLLKPAHALYWLAERLLSAFDLADNLVCVLRKTGPTRSPQAERERNSGDGLGTGRAAG
ncbi:MAG TPA: class I SAM-dependent methyltransferase [Verrucomicrobiae bacterium]|nr:class I SAM-dependent methyltransferase [Verrucomicrobiae bacterium]